jgi:hypothetical protein
MISEQPEPDSPTPDIFFFSLPGYSFDLPAAAAQIYIEIMAAVAFFYDHIGPAFLKHQFVHGDRLKLTMVEAPPAADAGPGIGKYRDQSRCKPVIDHDDSMRRTLLGALFAGCTVGQ